MMIKTQLITDKLAVTFSMVCVLHCFFTPSFIILTSTVLSVSVNNGFIHLAILLAATPISLFALILGYKNHKIFSVLLIGMMGLFTLIFALLLGESGEKLMTLMGSILVSYSHFRNHQICKSLDCSCHEG